MEGSKYFGVDYQAGKATRSDVEILRLKHEFVNSTINNSFLTFREFMEEIYLKYYQQKVQFVTYQTALPHHQLFIK